MTLRPRSLLGQVGGLAVAALIVAQIAGFWLFSVHQGSAVRAAQRDAAIAQAVRLADLLDGAPPDMRALMIDAATAPAVRFALDPAPLVPAEGAASQGWPGGRVQDAFRRHRDGPPPPGLAWLRAAMMRAGVAPAEVRVSLPLGAGDWLNAVARLDRPGAPWPPLLVGTTLMALALILAALWLGLRRITGPLAALARAADSIGLDARAPAMPRGGPREVRALADALARMQARLSALVGERTRMLAALGHDLRSPITVLRLRAEMVDDAETRDEMIAALDEMEEMAEATLAFARGVSPDSPSEPVDLAALLRDLAGELSASGPAIEVRAPEPVVLPLRRVAVRRALRNLLENAQRYGGGATATLTRVAEGARIVIEDDGPGIPAADLERVFDPFVRLETSRSRETGGSGLGLAIARSIVAAHGGTVTLENRAEGGLRVAVLLPGRDLG